MCLDFMYTNVCSVRMFTILVVTTGLQKTSNEKVRERELQRYKSRRKVGKIKKFMAIVGGLCGAK